MPTVAPAITNAAKAITPATDPVLRVGRLGWMAGGCILIMLWVCSVYEPSSWGLQRIDRAVFLALNSTLGLQATWDWTVMFASGARWYYLFAGFAFAFAVAQAWITRRQHYGKAFGIMIFAVAVMFTAEEWADQLSDRVMQPSPMSTLQFTDIGEMRDADFANYRRKSPVPDENSVALAALSLILLPRLPWGAFVSALGLMTYVLATMTFGRQWFFIHLGSIAGGVTFAGFALVGLRSVLRWLERESERVAIAIAWRHLSGLKDDDMAEREGEEARTMRKSDARDFWQHLVENDVLPLLQPGTIDYEILERSPSRPEASPTSRYVRFLRLASGEVVVIRAASRFGGLFHRGQRVRRLLRSARTNLLLERLGVPVPRTLWAHESPSKYGLSRLVIVVEEFKQGSPMPTDRLDALGDMAGMLARLHAQTCARWGEVTEASRRPRAQYLIGWLRPKLVFWARRANAHHSLGWSELRIDQLVDRILDSARTLLTEDSSPFRLIHGDMWQGNVLWNGPGQVHLIDFNTARFDFVAMELVPSFFLSMRERPEWLNQVWREYRRHAPPAIAEEFRRQAHVALACYALQRIAKAHNAPPRDIDAATWIEDLLKLDATSLELDGELWPTIHAAFFRGATMNQAPARSPAALTGITAS